MQISDIEFQINGVTKRFEILNNLDEYGLDTNSAFENWIARTNKYTAKSFCKYVVSKDPINFICTPHKNIT